MRSGILRLGLASGNVITGRRCSRSLVSESDAHGLALSVPLRESKLRVASLRVAMPQALRFATLASGIEGKI
ncbi:hypothetical protein [Nostoc sp.]|uniref:hypothetical protein n=1 Tax=Nostoc sp. TaxID=1180 RepID=UPI002FF73FD9